ncbi:phosphotransferase enzyme family protein [Paenibacillus spongiae]|uniref:Phosphotransferase n=1 Tax=Paenibacillus spongiae TaxID=2909671 RepID=A0ABY5S553_9BACL|nr:phosphotransferase [Paenibacillus spongiae]UVI29042.1 phosphotransferase [Paenibacillus spongiae]
MTDNAGGGVRGLRARPSAGLFHAVQHSYGIDGLEGSIDLGGSNTLNLLLADDHSRYVARVYRPCVTEARLKDIQLARQALHAGGVPSSEVLSARDGRQWTEFDGRLIEVEKYVESDTCMNGYDDLIAALPLLGLIHTILQGIQFNTAGRNPIFANHIEPDKALSMTLQGTGRIRGWNTSADFRLADAADELAHLVSDGEQKLISMLPRQVVHGDYWHNNVLFRNGRVVLVTDFDFMGERARIDDLALILYYFGCSNEPVSEKRLDRLRSLTDSYDEGLAEHLSITERLALPLAIARQPLWSIGGWIALLDDEKAARRHAAGMLDEVEFALRIVRELDKWQAAFT